MRDGQSFLVGLIKQKQKNVMHLKLKWPLPSGLCPHVVLGFFSFCREGGGGRFSKPRPYFRPRYVISRYLFHTCGLKNPYPFSYIRITTDNYTLFHTKTAQKPYMLAPHIPINMNYIGEYPPPPRGWPGLKCIT